ncbi:Aspartate decarboxylase-like domain-containing protein, partial [Cynara cardunculus var. scolymus]
VDEEGCLRENGFCWPCASASIGRSVKLIAPRGKVCKDFDADFDEDQMAVHVPFIWEGSIRGMFIYAQSEACLLMFYNMNLLSPTTGDLISALTQDMLSGLYVLMSGNCRSICVNRYNPCNRRNYQNEDYNRNTYDVIGAYWQKRINLGSSLAQLGHPKFEPETSSVK